MLTEIYELYLQLKVGTVASVNTVSYCSVGFVRSVSRSFLSGSISGCRGLGVYMWFKFFHRVLALQTVLEAHQQS